MRQTMLVTCGTRFNELSDLVRTRHTCFDYTWTSDDVRFFTMCMYNVILRAGHVVELRAVGDIAPGFGDVIGDGGDDPPFRGASHGQAELGHGVVLWAVVRGGRGPVLLTQRIAGSTREGKR